MGDPISEVLTDNGPIESICQTFCDPDNEFTFYRVGYQDVERIEPYAEPGAFGAVTWLRVIRHGEVWKRLPAATFEITYVVQATA